MERIVFLGPSLPVEVAKRILPDAEYRPPIRRGDLDDLSYGAVVGIIDGVFAQDLAISRGEISDALARGVSIYGASSMGALRAAELRGVVGVGRIYDMYRTGSIDRDDEVALLFNPDTFTPLTEALINIRYAVERVVRSRTIDRATGDAIIAAAERLHYTERTYTNVFRHSLLGEKQDLPELIALLRNFNLKRDDAMLMLETLESVRLPVAPSFQQPPIAGLAAEIDGIHRVREREDRHAQVLVWEYGSYLEFDDLTNFLKITGEFEQAARSTLARFAIAGEAIALDSVAGRTDIERDIVGAAQTLLDAGRAEWGWQSPEEAHVTFRDLGIGLDDLAGSLTAEVKAQRTVMLFGKHPSEEFDKALRAELWLNELSMKRAALRWGAILFFARRSIAHGPLSDADFREAQRCICRVRGVMRWADVIKAVGNLGMSVTQLDSFTEQLALARREAKPFAGLLETHPPPPLGAPTRRAAAWRACGLDVVSSLKADGSPRFSLSLSEAATAAKQIGDQMGLLRIGFVGELDTLGVHVAQAFGDRTGWSSSFSSGKAETRDGASVGAVMEEVEIHAQDAYEVSAEVQTSFAVGSDTPLVDPRDLDLPFDSRYHEELTIGWAECVDLLEGRRMLIPSACLLKERSHRDIYYSQRLGTKVFSSSGLGSGFTLAEAIVHAAAEYIERHSQRMAELVIDNPAGVGERQFWFVDHDTLPPTPKGIVDRFRAAGQVVRILDMTSEVQVPAFCVRMFDDPFERDISMSSDGSACHPNPEVAVTMALLEAAQSRAGSLGGAREDYSLRARSLGRTERPAPLLKRSQTFWFGNDCPTRSLSDTPGFISDDILEELEWMVDRVGDAGCSQFLIVDYTMERIRPAHAVRVIIPGLESTSPLFTGARARATGILDLLPRAPRSAPR